MSLKDKLADLLVGESVATNDEIDLVTSINGYTVETLEDILYARTAFRNFQQFCDSEEVDPENYDLTWDDLE